MTLLVAFLLIAAQEPPVSELLRRLEGGDIDVREKTENELAARGPAALGEVESALASAEGMEYRLRLKRIVRKLKLADLLARIPSQFSESFRVSAPDLLEKLKKPDPGILIEAIAATSGKAWHWEKEDKPGSHGTYKVQRQISREPLKGVTRADAVEVLMLAWKSVPEKPLDERWSAVYFSARAGINPHESADRRRFFSELLSGFEDQDLQRLLMSMVQAAREPSDIPLLIPILEHPDKELSRAAFYGLMAIPPDPHGDEIARAVPGAKPLIKGMLLRCLGKSKDRKFLKLILDHIDDPDPHVKSESFHAAWAFDKDSLTEIVLRKLKSADAAETLRGIDMASSLKEMGKPPRADFMAEVGRIFVETKRADLSQKAFELMVRAQGVGCPLESILCALTHPESGYRSYAIWMAGLRKEPEVRKALAKAVDDENEEVAAAAATVVAAAKEPCSIDRVRALMKSSSARARGSALYALSDLLGEKARDELAPFLDDPDPNVQASTLYMLQTSGKGLEPRLREKLSSPHQTVRMAAARSLAFLGDRESLPALLKEVGGAQPDYYRPLALRLANPEACKILNGIRLKVPGPDETAESFLAHLRSILKDSNTDLKVDLPEAILKAPVKKLMFEQPLNYEFWSLRAYMPQTDWFFDSNTLFILTPQAVRERWIAWANTK